MLSLAKELLMVRPKAHRRIDSVIANSDHKNRAPSNNWRLSEKQVVQFEQQGFTTIAEPIISNVELELLRSVIERLRTQKTGWNEGAQFDLIGGNDDPSNEQALPQILEPSNFSPALRSLQYRKTAFEIARQLLGPEASLCFEHAIIKPANSNGEVPWHQDEAYRVDTGFEYRQLSIWLTLQDVSLENGCMQYLPLLPDATILPHRPANDDPRVHALECISGFDARLAQPCPLPNGGAAIHGGLTLHYSGPNTTNQPRYAYVLEFELPPRITANNREASWSRKSVATDRLRRRAWFRRGGYFVFLYRKLRYASFSQPRGLAFAARRALRYVFRI